MPHSTRLLSRTRVGATLLALLVIAGLAPVGATNAGSTADGFLRVRVRLETRGDHTILRVPPGARVVNARVLASSGSGTYWDHRGFLVGHGDTTVPDDNGVAAAEFEAILSGVPGGVSHWRRVCEGGTASLRILNVNDRALPREAATAGDCSDGTAIPVDGGELRRNGPLVVSPAPADGKVFGHYVPWYWDGDYSCCYNQPLDSGATNDPGYVGRAIDHARNTGLDGFTVTTYGLPHRGLEIYLDEAARRPGWITVPQLATRIANPAKRWEAGTQVETLVEWIDGLMDAYGDHPSLLRLPDGRVVFLAYWAPTLPLSDWQRVIQGVAAAGHRISLVGEQVRPDWLHVFEGDYIFNTFAVDDLPATVRRRSELARSWHLLYPDASRKVWMGTASPGMNDSNADTGNRFVSRAGGDTYRQQWRTMNAGRADWHMIVSWNDYGEDTTIEMSVDWGRAYLDMTADEIGKLRALGR